MFNRQKESVELHIDSDKDYIIVETPLYLGDRHLILEGGDKVTIASYNPKLNHVSLTIYNERGELIFEAEDSADEIDPNRIFLSTLEHFIEDLEDVFLKKGGCDGLD